jgi:ankyrin repeat protein
LQNEQGATALHFAAYNGMNSLVSALLAKGARTDIKNK